MVILTTERLLLRHFHLMDRDAMLRVFGDAEVMRFGDGVHGSEWVEDWLRNCWKQYYQTWGFGPYAVVPRNRGEVIGYCGLFYFADINGKPEAEIAYRLARSAWGMGYATEAARAVRDYAFHSLGIIRLIAMIDPSNTASIRVAEKIGMQYEGEVVFEGYTHPDLIYGVENQLTKR
jgi:RimJ/RimL family protein N-acetyltransferase